LDVAFFGGYLLFPRCYLLDKDVAFDPSLSAIGRHNPNGKSEWLAAKEAAGEQE